MHEGWSALDQLLRLSTPTLDAEQCDLLSCRVMQRLRRARRRRQLTLLAAAASVLVALGISWWTAGLSQPAADPGAQLARVAPDNTAPADGASMVVPVWDDEQWSTEVAGAQQDVNDVDADWRVPLENWAGLRAQMDAFEDELDAHPL
ncbi:MAG TPA: hypothetical protein VHZ24_10990 [Pirellulales bacterium]|jgi:hypothetical protein|nr:hypothetical protein [Pirellulales bacterium]